jgi:uncharacterized protein DUF4209
MTDDTSRPPGALTDAALIREQLEALGISQREAARQLDIDNRTMRYYCAGKLPVPETVLLGLQEMRAAAARRAPLVVHPALQAALEAADRDPEPLDEFELSSRLDQVLVARGGQLEPAEKRGAFAIIGGLRFMSRRMYGNPVWDMHWQPLSGWTDNQGGVHHDPDVAHVDDGIVVEWSRLAQAAQHPVIRSRYADLAWELAKFRDTAARDDQQSARPIRPNVDNARIAIDAYLEAVARQLAQDPFVAWRYLGRATELAASIRDEALAQRAKAAVFAYREAGERDDPAYPFWQFDDIAWEQRDKLSASEKAVVIAALERSLGLRTDPSDMQWFDPHIAQDAADRLGRWLRPLGEKAEAGRAADAAGRAMEAAAEQSSGLTAIALLSDQAARYRSAGDEASAARVEQTIRRRAPEAKGEMKRVETRYEIPRQELDDWADQVAGATFEEGLRRIVAANLVRKERSEAGVRGLATQAVFHAHIPIQIMRDDGFVSAVIGPVKDDLDGRAIHHASNVMSQGAPFLNVSLTRFRAKHGIDLERLTTWISGSPLFPASRLALVREGLAAWLAEDWVKAVHVLLPQIEAALRNLLGMLGAPVMKPQRYHSAFQAIGLGEVLSHERFRALVPEDVRFHLRVLLQDTRGLNVRNETLHGLAAHELFGRGLANLMIHAVVMIGLIRLQPVAAGQGASA